MRIAASTLMLATMLAGCAAPPTQRAAAPLPPDPVLCSGAEECSLYWRRAQVWVTRHSAYKLQSVTDTVITTYGPTRYSVERAYRVTRVPGAEGRDEIVLESGCANLFGCSTGRDEDAESFRRYVRFGQ